VKPLLIACALSLFAGKSFADIAPDNSGATLFWVYPITQTDASGQAAAQFHVDLDHALLTVTSLRDLELGPDLMAVQADLNDNDTKAFATISRQHQLLAFVSGDKKATAYIKVYASLNDGELLFSDAHNSGALAAYLRKAFHIQPNSNKASAPPAQIKPTGA
jgi:hypothetical protein